MEKVRKHKILDHPILSLFLCAVGGYIFVQVGTLIFDEILNMFMGNGTNGNAIVSLAEIIAAVVLLLLHAFWFRKEMHNFWSPKGLGRGLLIGWGLLAVPASLMVINFISGVEIGNVGLALLYGLAPGIGEEVMFRVIPISIAMRSKNKKIVTWTFIISSVLFGLVHATNLIVGADPGSTLMQVIYATAIGMAMSAIYMRTGNIWITMVIHTFTDFASYLGVSLQESGGVLSDKMDLDNFIFLAIATAIFLANAFVAFRKSKRDEIPAVWDKIWGREEIPETVEQ